MKRILIILIVVLGVGAGAYWGFLTYQDKQKAPRFKTEAITRGAITSQVIATGTVNPVTLVQVGSQVSGTILKLYADFNSIVRKGQPIAQIDPALFQAKVDQTEADLKNARAALIKETTSLADNLRNLNRYKALFKDNLVSQNDLDQAQLKHDLSLAVGKTAEAQIETAQANLTSAKINLAYTTIRSPVNGTVVNRSIDVGQTVAASLQAPTLFTIAQDLTNMQVDTNVDEADIGRLKMGQPANFSVDSYPGEPFSAKVSQIRNAPTTVQNVVTYDVVLGVRNPELKLKPGMTANVSIVIEEKDGVLKIPNAALRFKPPQKESKPPAEEKKKRKGLNVWILGPENKLKPVPVKTGITDGKFTELLSVPLKEGDLVVTELQSGKEGKGPAGQQPASPMRGMRF